ncbi:YybH family protein [Aerolutibacter daejeonensis]|uniref:YybH family protein n=1 Tax=Aerolutibacter daejeonensis TaxID=346181 RepID=UPI000AADBE70|nr:nuclear transport factor 2 family protein [Lysobacter daejeonensis]
MLRTATITVLLLATTVTSPADAGAVATSPGTAMTAPAPADALAVAQAEVMAAERAFAKTMADRDHAAFAGFLAEETVFFSGEQATRGRAAVAESWARLYEGPDAPFSWEPDQVQVLDSGTLALSTGPVRDPSGKVIARFNSIWRREAPGVWKVVFDKGSPVCAPRTP